jgi:hypothetical protein
MTKKSRFGFTLYREDFNTSPEGEIGMEDAMEKFRLLHSALSPVGRNEMTAHLKTGTVIFFFRTAERLG